MIKGCNEQNDFIYYFYNTSISSKILENDSLNISIRINEDQLNSWICCLHLALSRNKNVKDNTIVYRGIRINFSKDVGIGSKFYLQEFASTSLKKEFCEQWIKHKGTIFIITIKNNGTNGHPNYCYYIEDISITPNQYEVLISSHCYFTVTNVTHEKEIDYVSLTCEGYLIE